MHSKCQMVILGLGEPKYHELLKEMRRKYPTHIAVTFGFDDPLAHRIYAGSDMFMMPSRYEPCGLGQLISFKYGTVPVVRATGGLADTVSEFDKKTGRGDGFTFEEYSSQALHAAVRRGVEVYGMDDIWHKLRTKVMGYDYSWNTSAKKYVSLYKKALAKIGVGASQRAGQRKQMDTSSFTTMQIH